MSGTGSLVNTKVDSLGNKKSPRRGREIEHVFSLQHPVGVKNKKIKKK